MNHLLITGSTGFIGSHAIESALASGFQVTAVARSLVSEPLSGVDYRQLDLFDAEQVSNVIATIRATHLLHTSWVVTPSQWWSSPDNERWVTASKALLSSFAEFGGQRVVVTGSCAEYDWSSSQPCNEMTSPVRPHTVYGRCKNELREWATNYLQKMGIRFAWGRLFFLYGPREHPDRLVPSVVRAMFDNKPVECTAGTQKRDFMYVDDAAQALIELVQSELTGPVNIASGSAVAVREVVEHIASVFGKPELVEFGARPTPPDDPALLEAKVDRLRNELRWNPKHSLASGLARTIAWWRNKLASTTINAKLVHERASQAA